MNKHQNKPVAVITGASRGIGREVALRLSEDGYHICLVSRNLNDLNQVLKQIESLNGSATVFQVDLLNLEDLKKFIADFSTQFNCCDLLFNNAAIWELGLFEIVEESFNDLINVNLRAPWFLMKEFIPFLKKAEKPFIVNLSSIGAKEGSSRTGAYGCTKRALLSISESASKILCKEGIKVTAICPSWTATDMAKLAASPYSNEEMIQVNDIYKTIKWLTTVSSTVLVPSVYLECAADFK